MSVAGRGFDGATAAGRGRGREWENNCNSTGERHNRDSGSGGWHMSFVPASSLHTTSSFQVPPPPASPQPPSAQGSRVAANATAATIAATAERGTAPEHYKAQLQ